MTSTTSQQTTLNIHWLTPDHVWQEITQVFASLPYWTGDGDLARWQGEGIDLWLSSEPSGVQITGTMPDDLWRPWLATLRRKLSVLLGYPIGNPEDGYAFYYWNETKKRFEPEPEPQAPIGAVPEPSPASLSPVEPRATVPQPPPAVIHAGHIYELRRPLHRKVFFWTTIVLSVVTFLSILVTFIMALEMVTIDTALARYGLYYDTETSDIYSYEESVDTSNLTTVMDRLHPDTQELLEKAIADPQQVKLVDLEAALIEVSLANDDYWTEVEDKLDQALNDQELSTSKVRQVKKDIETQRELEVAATKAIIDTYHTLDDRKQQFSPEDIALIQDNLATLIYPEGLLFEEPTIGQETAV